VLERRDDIVDFEGLTHFDRQALAADVVDNGQAAKTTALEERVGHEVHAPALIWRGQFGSLQSIGGCLATAWTLGAKIQAGQDMQPMYALVIHLPALAAQEDVNSTCAAAHARLSDLLDALGHRRIQVGSLRPIVPRCARLSEQGTRASNTDLIRILQVADQRLALCRDQSFLY
jgi:hypothetical protein